MFIRPVPPHEHDRSWRAEEWNKEHNIWRIKMINSFKNHGIGNWYWWGNRVRAMEPRMKRSDRKRLAASMKETKIRFDDHICYGRCDVCNGERYACMGCVHGRVQGDTDNWSPNHIADEIAMLHTKIDDLEQTIEFHLDN